jgi:hypothetical protein
MDGGTIERKSSFPANFAAKSGNAFGPVCATCKMLQPILIVCGIPAGQALFFAWRIPDSAYAARRPVSWLQPASLAVAHILCASRRLRAALARFESEAMLRLPSGIDCRARWRARRHPKLRFGCRVESIVVRAGARGVIRSFASVAEWNRLSCALARAASSGILR